MGPEAGFEAGQCSDTHVGICHGVGAISYETMCGGMDMNDAGNNSGTGASASLID